MTYSVTHPMGIPARRGHKPFKIVHLRNVGCHRHANAGLLEGPVVRTQLHAGHEAANLTGDLSPCECPECLVVLISRGRFEQSDVAHLLKFGDVVLSCSSIVMPNVANGLVHKEAVRFVEGVSLGAVRVA